MQRGDDRPERERDSGGRFADVGHSQELDHLAGAERTEGEHGGGERWRPGGSPLAPAIAGEQVHACRQDRHSKERGERPGDDRRAVSERDDIRRPQAACRQDPGGGYRDQPAAARRDPPHYPLALAKTSTCESQCGVCGHCRAARHADAGHQEGRPAQYLRQEADRLPGTHPGGDAGAEEGGGREEPPPVIGCRATSACHRHGEAGDEHRGAQPGQDHKGGTEHRGRSWLPAGARGDDRKVEGTVSAPVCSAGRPILAQVDCGRRSSSRWRVKSGPAIHPAFATACHSKGRPALGRPQAPASCPAPAVAITVP